MAVVGGYHPPPFLSSCNGMKAPALDTITVPTYASASRLADFCACMAVHIYLPK